MATVMPKGGGSGKSSVLLRSTRPSRHTLPLFFQYVSSLVPHTYISFFSSHHVIPRILYPSKTATHSRRSFRKPAWSVSCWHCVQPTSFSIWGDETLAAECPMLAACVFQCRRQHQPSYDLSLPLFSLGHQTQEFIHTFHSLTSFKKQ